MRKNMYKKPTHKAKTIAATARIVLTAAAVAVLGMIFYFAWKDGWEAVFAWFGGKYACLIFLVAIFAATAIMWLVMIVRNLRRFKEDD